MNGFKRDQTKIKIKKRFYKKGILIKIITILNSFKKYIHKLLMVLSKKGSLRIFLMKINPSQNFSSRANFHINFYKFLIESIENSCFSIQNFKRFRVKNVKCKLKFSVKFYWKFLKNFNRRGGWGSFAPEPHFEYYIFILIYTQHAFNENGTFKELFRKKMTWKYQVFALKFSANFQNYSSIEWLPL